MHTFYSKRHDSKPKHHKNKTAKNYNKSDILNRNQIAYIPQCF